MQPAQFSPVRLMSLFKTLKPEPSVQNRASGHHNSWRLGNTDSLKYCLLGAENYALIAPLSPLLVVTKNRKSAIKSAATYLSEFSIIIKFRFIFLIIAMKTHYVLLRPSKYIFISIILYFCFSFFVNKLNCQHQEVLTKSKMLQYVFPYKSKLEH
jgi:hypothetical protein